MRRALLITVLLFPAACANTPDQRVQYSSAAVGLATGVTGAAIYRATTGGCWANCRQGMYCDRDSGLCKPMPCPNGDCSASSSAAAPAPASPPPPALDPCRGLCFPGERCVVTHDIADCVPL